MLVTDAIAPLRAAVDAFRRDGDRIGCVMTMGALHDGHRRLIEAAVAECDRVVVTIFVNPTQFAPTEDFDAYPRPLEADLAVCREAGAAVVFAPAAATLYPDGFQTSVTVGKLAERWEGASRPTHFAGVCTVVLKLLLIAHPDRAYFGQKDFQQQAVLRRMVTDLNVPVELVTVPTVRESDGLAMSSRNAYLSAGDRMAALAISRGLAQARAAFAQTGDPGRAADALRETLAATPDIRLDYAVVVDSVTLREHTGQDPAAEPVAIVAGRVGQTRLIDNHPLNQPFPNG